MVKGNFHSFDNTSIYYEVEGHGPPLLFLYGLVCSKNHFKYQLEYFKKTHTVVFADYRGHHNSEVPRDLDSLTIQSMAFDSARLLDELKIEQAPVVGHSIGFSVALELYRRFPKRIKSLIIMNGCARAPLESLMQSNITQYLHPVLARLHSLFPTWMEKIWKGQADSTFTYWLISNFGFNPGLAKSDDIKTYIRGFAKMEMAVFLKLLENYEHYDATTWIHEIKVPTLIISGDNDYITPQDNQELVHQLVPQSELVCIENGSHCPQLDDPELINEIMEEFLNKNKMHSVSI